MLFVNTKHVFSVPQTAANFSSSLPIVCIEAYLLKQYCQKERFE
jgi:hypothetical protein